MITGPLKSQVDQLWNKFAAGGIANPLTTIEQITYLLFCRRLDEVHTSREKKANLLGKPLDKPIFATEQQDLRWSRFKDLDAETMFTLFRGQVFTFIKQINANGDSAYTRFMEAQGDVVD